ncbi:unnamed protein product [Blepharisma stoltei]|uniref:Superoxide dismutase n=1 Tax=Blepharisma stoltei TaxID=1481888 RepID=A0AAU9J954_9CILI|nr:unnamed protein product [Blepharisma stoltei]
MLKRFFSFKLPKLPFENTALEPLYDSRTLSFHHAKHHQTYVDKLNAALGTLDVPLIEIIRERAQHQTALRNNGGGHYNHCLFWLCLGKGKELPSGKLLAHINKEFGDFNRFKAEFTNAAVNTFGSGWAWLSVTPQGRLVITTSPNQDNPMMVGVYQATSIPFFTCDIWEHAYYLQYQNRRLEYVEKFWNIVNWNRVEEMYEQYALNQQPVPVDQLLQ